MKELAERELGKRAIACKGWRWMPGMLARPVGGGFPVRLNCNPTTDLPDAGNVRYEPDLTDPATLGCLRHQAAEAHGAWDIIIQTGIQPRMEGTHGWWRAIDSRGRKMAFGTFICPNDGTDLKVFALIKALEAAE